MKKPAKIIALKGEDYAGCESPVKEGLVLESRLKKRFIIKQGNTLTVNV